MAQSLYAPIMSQTLTHRYHLPTPRAREFQIGRYNRPGASLGLSADRTDELIQEVRKGLSFKTLESLSSKSGISVPALAAIIEIPERTLARRKAAGRLARDESPRVPPIHPGPTDPLHCVRLKSALGFP